ncbi:hypothetical protein ACFVRR_16820 [Gottfriedia sp. NPDC057948]|uniref:hypothetical protein n=1 Tax=Gottfriedia sp. NPDC057948 TaxID=3346287 RepID=UPI0036D997C3
MSIEFPVRKDYENGSIKDVLQDLGFQEDGREFKKDGKRFRYEGCDKYQSYIFSVRMNQLS